MLPEDLYVNWKYEWTDSWIKPSIKYERMVNGARQPTAMWKCTAGVKSLPYRSLDTDLKFVLSPLSANNISSILNKICDCLKMMACSENSCHCRRISWYGAFDTLPTIPCMSNETNGPHICLFVAGSNRNAFSSIVWILFYGLRSLPPAKKNEQSGCCTCCNK